MHTHRLTKKKPSSLSNATSRKITRSTPPCDLPPLPPLDNNIIGTGPHALELANLSGGSNAETDYFEDKFLALLPVAASGKSEELLDGVAPVDKIDGTPLLGRSLFNDGVDATMPSAGGVEQEVVAALTNLVNFPSNFGTRHNRFTNQNSALNDEGYDSEGKLPHFADKPNDDIEDYFEEPATC